MLIACLGDIMLDVLVSSELDIVPDGDTPAKIDVAAGGQAANVAAWAKALGADAHLFGPRSTSGAGRVAMDALTHHGVTVHGPITPRSGTVISLLTGGTRSMASDPGSVDWLAEVADGPWLHGADWFFISSYALMRAPQPELIVGCAAAARSRGTKVAIDLSSATMIHSYGSSRFRQLWQSLEPSVVFANDEEWAASSTEDGPFEPTSFGAGGRTVLVLKHGPGGCSFVIDGVSHDRAALPADIVDVTGAGDSLTAGYLVGGPDLAMETAARCISHLGAQPLHWRPHLHPPEPEGESA